jgi:hypothetical protein
MSEGSDSLHFNCVSFFKGMVKNTRGINHLPSSIFVLGMSNEQTLGGKGIGLHINIGLGDVVHERGLSDIWVTSENEGSTVYIDCG